MSAAVKLSRFAGVSEAGACRRNPEQSEGSLQLRVSRVVWHRHSCLSPTGIWRMQAQTWVSAPRLFRQSREKWEKKLGSVSVWLNNDNLSFCLPEQVRVPLAGRVRVEGSRGFVLCPCGFREFSP